MYTLYTDKSENFKCNIGVEGADLAKTTARIVLENKNVNLMFEGSVDKNGNCVIPIKKLKNILPEGTDGKMKLEVVADETFFSPWEDSFSVKVNKKVTVEVFNDTRKSQIKETKIKVQVSEQSKPKRKSSVRVKKQKRLHSEIMSEVLNKKGITLNNFSNKMDIALPLIEKYIKRYKVKESPDALLNEIIINLK